MQHETIVHKFGMQNQKKDGNMAKEKYQECQEINQAKRKEQKMKYIEKQKLK